MLAFRVGEVCGLLKAAILLLDPEGRPHQRVREALTMFGIVSENLQQDYIRSRTDLNKINACAQSKLLDAISELTAHGINRLGLSSSYRSSFPSTNVSTIIASAADHISRLGTQ